MAIPASGSYSCRPFCNVSIFIEGITAAVGPAGDTVHIPLRITGGQISGPNSICQIIAGLDFATMSADEQLIHNGRFVIGDPAGDILIWYVGVSRANEGAYDELLDGRLPRRIPSKLCVHAVSTNPTWRFLTRRPLIGVGYFDGDSGSIDVTLLTFALDDVLSD